MKEVNRIIDDLGGPAAVARLIGLKTRSAPTMWKSRESIPWEHYLPIRDALRARRKPAPDKTAFGSRER